MIATLRASWLLAWHNLSGRPWRTALIIGAVTIAASLAVAVSCAISSVQRSMEIALVRVLGKADARIIHPGLGRFDESILDQVNAWPEVAHASGRVTASLMLMHSDRRVKEDGRLILATPMAVGVDFEVDAIFLDTELVDGRMPDTGASNEVLLDVLAAEEMQASVGDELMVHRLGDPIALDVVGVYQRQRLIGAIQRPQIRIDRSVLQEAAYVHGELSSIMILTQPGVNVERFCETYAGTLPEQISIEPAEKVRTGFDRRVEASRFAVLITSILTFMSAAFIIVTALTTSVTERQREMAVVRSIGASRSQLFFSQILLGITLGLIGALIAIPLGIALAGLLISWFSEQLPAGLHISTQGVTLAIVGSIIAGLLGALYPAYIASRVTPMEAMTLRGKPPRMFGIVLCTCIGLALIALQLILLLPNLAVLPGMPEGADGQFYRYMYIGLPGVHIGYFVLAVPMLMVTVLVLAPLVSFLLRLPAGMLGRSLLAMPYRHGFTAGALMVGISILVSTWGGTASLMRDWVGKIEFADGFVYHPTGISQRHQHAIANLPFVTDVCPIGFLSLRVVGQQVFGVSGLSSENVIAVGFDPRVFFTMNAVEWMQGDPEVAIPRLLDGDAVIVADRFLVARNIGLGDRITLASGRVERDFEIVGVVGSPGLEIAIQTFGVRNAYMEYAVSCVFLDHRAVASHFNNHDAYLMQVNLSDEVSDDDVEAAIASAAPGVRFRSGRWILEQIHTFLATLLAVQSVIAFAALFLACLGAGNVIAANIHARRYEYGVLRAVGAHRGVLLRLIFAEAAVLAIAGAAVGTILGVHLTWVGTVFYRELAGIELRTAFATIPVAIGWGVLLLMTLAAAAPAAISLMRRQPTALLATGRNG